jgi:hypothetical protein
MPQAATGGSTRRTGSHVLAHDQLWNELLRLSRPGAGLPAARRLGGALSHGPGRPAHTQTHTTTRGYYLYK